MRIDHRLEATLEEAYQGRSRVHSTILVQASTETHVGEYIKEVVDRNERAIMEMLYGHIRDDLIEVKKAMMDIHGLVETHRSYDKLSSLIEALACYGNFREYITDGNGR